MLIARVQNSPYTSLWKMRKHLPIADDHESPDQISRGYPQTHAVRQRNGGRCRQICSRSKSSRRPERCTMSMRFLTIFYDTRGESLEDGEMGTSLKSLVSNFTTRQACRRSIASEFTSVHCHGQWKEPTSPELGKDRNTWRARISAGK